MDKYFGFLKIQDEYSVMESLLEHCRIDEEEVHLLGEMVEASCNDDIDKIEEYYGKIRKISADSRRIFEHTAEQIIQANFSQQKQYDLLRIYQRIESISGMIIASAKRIVILFRIGGSIPKELHPDLKTLMISVNEIHHQFKNTLLKYQENKQDVITSINKVEEMENNIDHLRSICLEALYKVANQDRLQMGNFRAIENVIEHLEEVSDAIEEAATSLEWLLIY